MVQYHIWYYLAGTQSFPTGYPSPVYIADIHGVYESKYPLLIKKTSFEVKHSKIETVVLSRSAQAHKLKKTVETPRPQVFDNHCLKGDKSAELGDVILSVSPASQP